MSAPKRLPNGLTPEQDAAFDRLAEAISDYWWQQRYDDAAFAEQERKEGR